MEVTLGNIKDAIEFISILKSKSISTADLKIVVNSAYIDNSEHLKLDKQALPVAQEKNIATVSLENYSKKQPSSDKIKNILNKDRFLIVKQRLIELASTNQLDMEGYKLEDLENNTARFLQKRFHVSRYHKKSAFSIWEKQSLITSTLKTDEFISEFASTLKWDINFVRDLLKIQSRKGKHQKELDEVTEKEEKIAPLNARIGYKNFVKHVNQLIQNGKLQAPKFENIKFNDYLATISKTTGFEVKDRNIFWMWQSLGQVKQMLNPEVVKNICRTFHLTEEEFTDIISNNQLKKSATN